MFWQSLPWQIGNDNGYDTYFFSPRMYWDAIAMQNNAMLKV
jgi:hypothetical protein